MSCVSCVVVLTLLRGLAQRDALEVPNTADNAATSSLPSTPEESALDVDGQQAAVVVQPNSTAPVAAAKKPSPKGPKVRTRTHTRVRFD